MGYTHYATRTKKDHDVETWKKFVADCKYLYKHMPAHSLSAGGYHANAPLMLNGCGAFEKPQFTASRIHFNGTGATKRELKTGEHNGKPYKYWEDVLEGVPQEHQDLGHETFVLQRKQWRDKYGENTGNTLFSFCKTARKPYDLMVTACLILYKYYFKQDVEIGSDGDEEDWREAFLFIADTLPHGAEVGTEMVLSNTLFEKVFAA